MCSVFEWGFGGIYLSFVSGACRCGKDICWDIPLWARFIRSVHLKQWPFRSVPVVTRLRDDIILYPRHRDWQTRLVAYCYTYRSWCLQCKIFFIIIKIRFSGVKSIFHGDGVKKTKNSDTCYSVCCEWSWGGGATGQGRLWLDQKRVASASYCQV